MKPLLAIFPEAIHNINKRALYQYLKYTYIHAPDTIFKNINQLVGGGLIAIKNTKMTTLIYDPWDFSADRVTNEQEAIEKYHALLSDSIKTFLTKHHPTVFLLSGGLDTSVNVALGVKHVSEPLVTIGIGDTKSNTDAPYARMVSDLFNTKHQEYLFDGSEIENLPQLVWLMENPYYEPGLFLSYASLKSANEYAPNVIGGDAADQVFGSCATLVYKRFNFQHKLFGTMKLFHHLIPYLTRMSFIENNYLLTKVEQRLIGKYNVNNWCGVYGFRDSDIKQLLRHTFSFEEIYRTSAVPDNNLNSLLDYGCSILNRGYTLNGLLSKNGRISDYLGLNYYSPYLDKTVFNFILSLAHTLRNYPSKTQDFQFTTKYLHRQLANILLPHEIVNRAKQGGAIHSSIHLDDINRLKGIKKVICRSDFLNNLFHRKIMEDLFVDIPNNSVRILLLLILDLWHFIFVDNPIQPPNFSFNKYLNL
jgi:asparagine synthase (glutamine-hydrolysing)